MARGGLDVRSSLRGVSRADRMAGKIQGRARDLRPAFRVFDRTVGEEYRKQFESRGRRFGTGWKPLSPRTKEARQRTGGNRGGVMQPLWDTARLKRSFQEVGGDSVRVVRRHRYERGSRVRYGAFHQDGRGVPERKIVPEKWPGFLERRWIDVAGDYLAGRVTL